MFDRFNPVPLLVVASVLAVGAAPPRAAGFEERFEFEADSLLLSNLIGEITLEGHDGSAFEVEVQARGQDASPETLRIELREGRDAELDVRFPLDQTRRYVYPPLGSGSQTSFDMRDGRRGGLSGVVSWIFGGGSRIQVSGSGRGLELWADVKVRVPRGSRVEVRHGAGQLRAENVEGDLVLGLHSGRLRATAIRGDLVADTGSGNVVVEDAAGNLAVDTGSGSVDLARVEGDRVLADTGSGRIRFDGVRAGSVNLDTGSGSVKGGGLSADSAVIDTGSGSIEVAFDRVGEGRFDFDTGSGSIRIALPENVSATFHAETGSGSIDVGHPGARMRQQRRGEADFVIGEGAARFRLDTGSGSIRVTSGG